ncbi:MAG: LysR family transcriptional regulator [Hyphomicrobium sp.]|uniref:LysR family transcriptional regulator n=1 Tax=Hyphomicrobium sp. TaxID=82 RepID=UPI003D120515
MDRIDLLRIFARVVECASFTRAANTLQMPRSSVSTAVSELEALVGTRLMHRTTRSVAPTQDGSAFYERCVRLIADFEETEGLFRQSSARPHGKLRVSVPGRLGRLVIAPALPAFLSRYPDVEIELGVTDRAVDLVQDNFDLALRVGPLQDSGLIARKVGDLVLLNCASAAYLAERGVPTTVADLAQHLAVKYASPTTGRTEDWEYVADGEVKSLALPGRVTVNSAEAYIACCLAGLGLIQIPAYDVLDHLLAGELVEVMPGLRAEPMPATLLYAHRLHLSRRVQVFIEWLLGVLQERVMDAQVVATSRR